MKIKIKVLIFINVFESKHVTRFIKENIFEIIIICKNDITLF